MKTRSQWCGSNCADPSGETQLEVETFNQLLTKVPNRITYTGTKKFTFHKTEASEVVYMALNIKY